MFDNIENIKLIYALIKERKKVSINDRKSHILIFFTKGGGTYKIGKTSLNSSEGDIVYIPQGSSYTFEPTGDVPCYYLTITFLADIKNPRPTVFDGSNFPGLNNIIMNIRKNLRLRTPYSKHICLSWFHSILAYLVTQENKTYYEKKKYNLIQPALYYIDENLSDPDLKTDMLHSLCGISQAYFRRIFNANVGLTPQKYIEEKRLEYAMCIIKEHEYPISVVAEMSGYNDPLYFGKVFKKKYGISPSYVRQADDEAFI